MQQAELIETVYLGRDNVAPIDFQIVDDARGDVQAPYFESITLFELHFAGSSIPPITVNNPDSPGALIEKFGRINRLDGTQSWRLLFNLGGQAIPPGDYPIELYAFQGAADTIPTALLHPENPAQKLTLRVVR